MLELIIWLQVDFMTFLGKIRMTDKVEVLMFVAEHMGAVRGNEFEIRQLEIMWVKPMAGSNTIILMCYRFPNARAEFCTMPQDSVDFARRSGCDNIILNSDSLVDSADILNYDLKRLTHWAEEWIRMFNPPKTKSLLITKKKSNDPVSSSDDEWEPS